MSWQKEVIQMIHCQLVENRDSGITPSVLSEHGRDTVSTLLSTASSLSTSSSMDRTSCETLDALIDLAYQKMMRGQSVNFWRMVYTEASVLRSLSGLGIETASHSIGTLDRAIIIAGAAGTGRLELIQSLIERIQAEYFPHSHFKTSSTLPRVDPQCKQFIKLDASLKEVACFDTAPSFVTFQRDSCRMPFILRGFAHDWPALTNHPWASFDYLRSVGGPGRIIPVEVGKDYRNDDWTQKLMGWDEFLSYLAFEGKAKDVLYLAQHNVLMQFPALRDDIVVPDYVYACPSPPADYPGYEPPKNEDQLVINAWLGPQGTISPAHTDPYFNVYVQTVGRKTVWLAPPATSQHMYASYAEPNENPAANTTNPSMSNTSRVDVFSAKDIDALDHPEFWEKVVPHASSATLEPGDLLFFPPGWWHAMRSEEMSFSVSMWF